MALRDRPFEILITQLVVERGFVFAKLRAELPARLGRDGRDLLEPLQPRLKSPPIRHDQGRSAEHRHQGQSRHKASNPRLYHRFSSFFSTVNVSETVIATSALSPDRRRRMSPRGSIQLPSSGRRLSAILLSLIPHAVEIFPTLPNQSRD